MPDGGMYAPPAFGMCATPKRAGRPRSQAARNDAMIARRSQTSQDDVCATPGKLKEKPQSLWEARLCATCCVTRQPERASGSGSSLALQFEKNETGAAHTFEPVAAAGKRPSGAAARSRGP